MKYDISIKVGGAAGQGIQTIGAILSKAIVAQGLHLFAHQDYYSRVRGGHNFYQVRASDNKIHSFKDEIEILVALDQASITIHHGEVSSGGVIVYDSGSVKWDGQEKASGLIPVALADMGREYGGDPVTGNTVAAGIVWGLLGGDEEFLEEAVNKVFSAKKPEMIAANLKAARMGILYVRDNYPEYLVELPALLANSGKTTSRMVITGNEALGLGSLAAGCCFISSYPMTPASGVMQYMLRQTGRLPLIFEQAEDEIAAIHMSLGAAYAGLRSMVATSGGGFSLMVEGLSLAGCTETPIVIVMGQRPGPATGMATRTEQGELLFCLHAGHGEFPRAILAPGDPEEAFYMAVMAFNLAEKYQIPVFIMSDQHLADSYVTLEPFDLSKVEIERGSLLSDEELNNMEEYRRYAYNETGVSPRAFPGQGGKCVVSSGNEHDEYGYSTEDASVRVKMVAKRMKKSDYLRKDMPKPVYYGDDKPETLLFTWGSAKGACFEAIDMLRADGEKVAVLHIPGLWPFPVSEVNEILDKAGRVVSVEMNYTGQLGRLLRTETGRQPDFAILKYDGRPMNGKYVTEELKRGGSFPW